MRELDLGTILIIEIRPVLSEDISDLSQSLNLLSFDIKCATLKKPFSKHGKISTICTFVGSESLYILLLMYKSFRCL